MLLQLALNLINGWKAKLKKIPLNGYGRIIDGNNNHLLLSSLFN